MSTVKRQTHIKLFENNVRMSEKLQGFVLFLPTIGGQDAVDVLLDGIVFSHTFFQASVLSVQPILFFGQSGIFLAQLGKVGELITDTRRFQRPRRRFKENDFALTSAQILFLVTGFLVYMKPHSHNVGVARAFDCFCKKVLRNEARDYQDALARKRNREVYFSELPVEVLEQFAVRDTYFTDSRTFEVIGHSVCIDDETLAEAISALPVDRRDIILLSYFLDMSDAEIANVLNMVRRSVAYRRTSTLKLLKNLMGGENR